MPTSLPGPLSTDKCRIFFTLPLCSLDSPSCLFLEPPLGVQKGFPPLAPGFPQASRFCCFWSGSPQVGTNLKNMFHFVFIDDWVHIQGAIIWNVLHWSTHHRRKRSILEIKGCGFKGGQPPGWQVLKPGHSGNSWKNWGCWGYGETTWRKQMSSNRWRVVCPRTGG